MAEQGGAGRSQPSRARRVGPKLRLAHGEATIRANSSVAYWEEQETEAIVASLQPGARTSLMVKPDGTILDGNTRVWILRQRGFDVDSLPREVHVSRPLEDFDG